MVIDILSIPLISVEAEQVFLGARRTVLWERILLGSTSIKRTECLKSWLLSNITADGRLMATNVVQEASELLAGSRE
jgi:hAT family C-terminal dimerisation region